MIWVDRCSFCKHKTSKPGDRNMRCKAFPNGFPRGFWEDGKECNNGYRFELIESKREEYERIWERPSSAPKLEKPYISPNGRVYVE